jgi:serine protease
MSLSGPGFSQTFQDLITICARTGHDLRRGRGQQRVLAPQYPAGFAGVISVSAVGPTRTLAPYSNYGATIDVAAPGGDFQRDVDGDGFPTACSARSTRTARLRLCVLPGHFDGAPHVSGVLALMLGSTRAHAVDIDNALNARQITEDIGSSQFFGNGLIDAARAVNSRGGGRRRRHRGRPVLRIDPDGLNFGFSPPSSALGEQRRQRSAAAHVYGRTSRATTARVAHVVTPSRSTRRARDLSRHASTAAGSPTASTPGRSASLPTTTTSTSR